MGGLTVLRALEKELPEQSFIYLGDTARLPYGTKSAATVQRYALRASRELVDRGVSALVVACNTASAMAIDTLRAEYSSLPCFGVVEPGAAAACAVPDVARVAVFATESTVRGGAYQRALLGRSRHLTVRARPCQLLVALAEEGWLTGEIPDAVLQGYLGDWLSWRPDVLLLGCTHFPVFREQLQRLAGPEVTIVDSAQTTAMEVARAIAQAEIAPPKEPSRRVVLATDDVARFRRVGQHFLGEALGSVELVDI